MIIRENLLDVSNDNLMILTTMFALDSFGSRRLSGHRNFIINLGRSQPDGDWSPTWSHSYAHKLYTLSAKLYEINGTRWKTSPCYDNGTCIGYNVGMPGSTYFGTSAVKGEIF